MGHHNIVAELQNPKQSETRNSPKSHLCVSQGNLQIRSILLPNLVFGIDQTLLKHIGYVALIGVRKGDGRRCHGDRLRVFVQ